MLCSVLEKTLKCIVCNDKNEVISNSLKKKKEKERPLFHCLCCRWNLSFCYWIAPPMPRGLGKDIPDSSLIPPAHVCPRAGQAHQELLSFLGSSSVGTAFGEDILVFFHLWDANCRLSLLLVNLSSSCREKVSSLNVSMGSTGLSQKTFRYPGGLPVAHRWTVHTAINGSSSIPGPRSPANKLTCSGFVTRKSK